MPPSEPGPDGNVILSSVDAVGVETRTLSGTEITAVCWIDASYRALEIIDPIFEILDDTEPRDSSVGASRVEVMANTRLGFTVVVSLQHGVAYGHGSAERAGQGVRFVRESDPSVVLEMDDREVDRACR